MCESVSVEHPDSENLLEPLGLLAHAPDLLNPRSDSDGRFGFFAMQSALRLGSLPSVAGPSEIGCRDLESVRGVVDVVDRAVVLGLEEEGVEVQGPHAHVLVLAGRGHEPTVARKRP